MSASSPAPSRPESNQSFSLFPDDDPQQPPNAQSPDQHSEPHQPTAPLNTIPEQVIYPNHTKQIHKSLVAKGLVTPSKAASEVGDASQYAPRAFSMDSSDSDFDHDDPTAAVDGQPRYAEPDGVQNSYDLHAPTPAAPLTNIELLAQRLFSLDHLKLIVRDATGKSNSAQLLSIGVAVARRVRNGSGAAIRIHMLESRPEGENEDYAYPRQADITLHSPQSLPDLSPEV